MESSDEQLLTRIRAGDTEAFDALYRRREPGLFRFALHMTGNRAIAEEITQEAFLSLARKQSAFDGRRGTVEGYLYGTVRNLARAARRDRTAPMEFDVLATDDVRSAMIADEGVAALRSAIGDLAEPLREAVVLCDLEEKSYEDAARILGVPLGTVRSRLHRARAALARKLRPAFRGAAR